MNTRTAVTDAALDRMLTESAPPVEVDPTDVPRIVRRAAAAAEVRGRRRLHGGVVAACALLGLAGVAAAAVGPTVFPDPEAVHEGGGGTLAAVIRLQWQQPDGRRATCGYQSWYTGRLSAKAESALTAYVRDHDWSDLNRRLVESGSLRGYANVPPQVQAGLSGPRSTLSPGVVVVHGPTPSTTPPPVTSDAVGEAMQAAADSVVGAGRVRFRGTTLISCAAG